MELAYGRALFDRYGRYESDPGAITVMLEDAATGMQQRAAELAGRQRDHQPTTGHPFTVIVVDEVAFLTAYQPDRKLRDRTMAALATSPPRAGLPGTASSPPCRTPARTS